MTRLESTISLTPTRIGAIFKNMAPAIIGYKSARTPEHRGCVAVGLLTPAAYPQGNGAHSRYNASYTNRALISRRRLESPALLTSTVSPHEPHQG
jgi:hypothetical protein